MKNLFLILLSFLFLVCNTKMQPQTYNFSLLDPAGGSKSPYAQPPFPHFLSTDLQYKIDDTNYDGFEGAVSSSFSSWSNAGYVSILGPASTGLSVTTFSDDQYYGGIRNPGRSYPAMNGGGAISINYSWVALNTVFTFSSTRQDLRQDVLDVQSILTHEVGHIFGLAHPPVDSYTHDATAPTMAGGDNEWFDNTTDCRTLESADVNGCLFLQTYVPNVWPSLYEAVAFGNSIGVGKVHITSSETLSSDITLYQYVNLYLDYDDGYLTLGNYSVFSNGGTIENMSRVTDLGAHMKQGETMTGYFISLPKAITYANSGKTIYLYKDHSLTNNITVPSGVMLNLNNSSITPSGGILTVPGVSSIAGMAAYLKSGANLIGCFPSFQEAINHASSGQTIYLNSNQTIYSNITIPSGVTLNLNGYSMIISGGSITLASGASFEGLNAYLKSGSTIIGYCPDIQSALNYASSGQTVQAINSQNINSNCSVASGITLSVGSGVTLTFGSNVRLSVSGILSANGATFQGNGSAGSWNSISFYSGSSGSVQSCIINDAQCGIYATTGASVTCSDNTITNNSLYGLSIINNSNVAISGCTISYNGIGINLYGSTASISGNSILNNSNYGVDAENVGSSYPWENNTMEGNGYAMILNNTSPILLGNMITSNGHGIVISSSDPSFGYRAGGSGYNAITCSSTPLFKAENYSDVYAGSDGGGNNSIFGSDLPDMEAVSYSSIDADNNYWGSQYPAIYADGTSWISANNPLPDDPNPGSSCMGKISASKDYAAILNAEDEDISNLYHQAHSYGNKKDYKTAKDLLKSIIYGKFDKKYSPLSLLDFYNFSIQEQQAKDSSSKSFESTKDYVDLVQELYRRPASDSLRPFAVRLLARGAALSNNHADLVKYNTEVVNNYPNSSNELAALYDLVNYYNEIESDQTKAGKFLTRMKTAYPEEDLTLFAQINMGEKVDIYNRPNKRNYNTTEIPSKLYLGDAYPNPFNPSTTITYSLKERDHITLVVYDILGKEAARLVEGIQSEGEHTVSFDGSKLPSGIYIYHLTGTNFKLTKKMLMIK